MNKGTDWQDVTIETDVVIIGTDPCGLLQVLERGLLDMHAIQTSGNCIRNTTTDPLTGAFGEVEQLWAQSRNSDDTFTPGHMDALKAQLPAAPPQGTLNTALEEGADTGNQPGQMLSEPLFNPGYQLTMGGHAGNKASLGQRLGKAIAKSEVANAIDQLLEAYIANREPEESFHDVVLRLSTALFKEKIHATAA